MPVPDYTDLAAVGSFFGFALGAGSAVGLLFVVLSWLIPGVRDGE